MCDSDRRWQVYRETPGATDRPLAEGDQESPGDPVRSDAPVEDLLVPLQTQANRGAEGRQGAAAFRGSFEEQDVGCGAEHTSAEMTSPLPRSASTGTRKGSRGRPGWGISTGLSTTSASNIVSSIDQPTPYA